MNSTVAIIASALLTAVIILDIASSQRNKAGLKEVIYPLYKPKSFMDFISILFMIAVIAFNLYVYFSAKETLMLYIAYWIAVLLVKTGYNVLKTGGIYEGGIWFSGRFFAWSEVLDFKYDAKSPVITFVVRRKRKAPGAGSKLGLQANRAQLDEIIDYLTATMTNERLYEKS